MAENATSSGTAGHAGPVVTRFAPSPTGHLHVGGARSALFCWAYARRSRQDGRDGRFMIRIEDTDQARSSDESARGILEDLAWLGIEWDDGPELRLADGRVIGGSSRAVGPFFQARRVALYDAYIEALVKAGRAYPAFDTPEETERLRKQAVAEKRTFKYPRPSDVRIGEFNRERWERALKGERHVVRFAMDERDVVVHDLVLGDVKIAPGEVDDFVIRKQDGFPTYHFAVVIDDELMGVTHVMRAQEHLINTPRHVALQRALVRLDTGAAFRVPAYAHMPLIFNMDGTKMSKRDKAKAARKALKDAMSKDAGLSVDALAREIGVDAKTLGDFAQAENDSLDVAVRLAGKFRLELPEIEVEDFRKSGYLPEAIVNFLGLLGWNPGMKAADGKDVEKFDMAFLAQHFSIERIGKTSAKFDRVKLLSFNADSIAAMDAGAFAARWREYLNAYEPAKLAALEGTGKFEQIAAMVKPRSKTLKDALAACAFVLTDDEAMTFDAKAGAKALGADAKTGVRGIELLEAVRERLAAMGAFDAGAIQTIVDQLAQQRGVGVGAVAQALRFGVTGGGVSPGIGETLAVLGKARTLRRVDRCLELNRV